MMLLDQLIMAYQTDPDSTYHKLRHVSRVSSDALMRRLAAAHGSVPLAEVKARSLIAWHKVWIDGGKIAMGHAFVGQLRTLVGFGATILEDAECERLCGILHKMRFTMSKPRLERITAEQANAVRAVAHAKGWHSIALAQALQFELMLRQKDVIGEWVPVWEPGLSEVVYGEKKWITGLRWSEIDEGLILRHTTSKRQKDIEVDLRLAPMVMAELPIIKPGSGPIIVNEVSGRPYVAAEWRRKWRIVARCAGVPDTVFNMDSRAGGISEATDAGAPLEHIRHAATHSNIGTTQNYSRGSVEKVAKVMELRAAHRNQQ